MKSEFGNLDPQLFQFAVPLLSLEEAGTAWPGHAWAQAGRERAPLFLLLGESLHHLPAVEGGVGDDGDVRGELAPDPAKRKHRETLMGTKTDNLESDLSWDPPLPENLHVA